jgi:two-component system sensor histidine kinase GlrK
LLIGFALAMLPLLIAFINANIYFEKLTKQSLFNLSQAVETTRATRIISEELRVMERSARQFFVLHDGVLLNNYRQAHHRLQASINALSKLPIAPLQQQQLKQFVTQENSLFSLISQADKNDLFDQKMIDAFSNLTVQAHEIIVSNNVLLDKQSAVFKKNVAYTQQLLFWQAMTLIPLAILIAGLITWMISRPIRLMDVAIHQLGQGNYEQIAEINGPGDLRQLGQRLNWLRVALKDLHQQKQQFLQQASHEFKTPLTAIREASELLSDGVGGKLTAQQLEITHILRDSSLRLQKMIENLLNYTETQFNALKLKPTPLVLADVMQEVTHAYALTITSKNLHISQSIDNIVLHCDLPKLRAVLTNLISNAVKFTPNNGEIQILATQSKTMTIIEVIDSGPGFKGANMDELFEPFYRGEQPYQSLVAGSGLGLFIAREAAKALAAELSLKASASGAHFIFRLPIIN